MRTAVGLHAATGLYLNMKFEIIEPDKLTWPGKYGLIKVQEGARIAGDSDWEMLVGRSKQLFMIPSGRDNEPSTAIFASAQNLGLVELANQHGYIWPVNPPSAGRAIMEKVIRHLGA